MSNRRLSSRWLPHCNSFLLGATAAFCYSQYRHAHLAPAAAPTPAPSLGFGISATETAPAAATPQPTPRIAAAPVLRTPPLKARAKPPAPKDSAPPAPSPETEPSPGRITRAPVDLGRAPTSTWAEAAAPDSAALLLPERASAKALKPAPPAARASTPAATRLAAAPAGPERQSQNGPPQGAEVGGDERQSESSASAVAGAVSNSQAPEAAPPVTSGASGATGTASDAAAAPSIPADSTATDAPILAPETVPPAANSSEDAPASTSTSGISGAAGTGGATPDLAAPAGSAAGTATPASTSLAPSGGSTLPERAEEGISSRATTSKTNALSPAPPEAQLPEPSVSAPLPSLNSSTINAIETDPGVTRPGPEPLLSPIGVPADAASVLASGAEPPSNEFGLTSDTPALFDAERGITLAQGRVTLSYGTFRATGKRGVIYSQATPRIAQLSDDLTIVARVRGREQTFRGEALTFNLDTGRWDLTGIRATFPPELFPRGQVLEPLFLRDGRVFGRDQDAGGSEFRFSSCDEDHYDLQTREINFYRDEAGRPDRIVLKHNALYLFGRKVLPLPNFVYSLQGNRSRRSFLQPQVGRNAIDGFFAKTVYDLSANAGRTDSLLIDALQKRGLGLGLQRELANGAGLFYLYAVSGGSSGREVDARVNRNFNLGRSISSVFNFDSTTNNSLTGTGYSNTTGSLNLNYAPASGTASGSALLSINNTKNPFSTYSQRQGSLDYSRQLGQSWDVSLNTQYNATNSGDSGLSGETTESKQEVLDNTLAIGRRSSRFDAALRAELHDDLTGRTQVNGAYALERLPELELRSDPQRLGLGALAQVLPGSLSLSMGTYNEPSTQQKLTRTRFEYQARGRQLRLVEGRNVRSRFDVGGGFRQNSYSDDTARYDYETSVGFNTELGRLKRDNDGSQFSPLRFLATYQKLKPTGYTPFQWDALAPNEVASATGIFQPSRKARLEIAGGRDIRNGIARDLTGTLRLLPSRAISMDVRTSYSLEQSQFNDVLADVNIVRPRDRFLGGQVTIGTRYSPQQSTFSTINLGADVQLGSKTRFQAFTSYNGFAKQFDVQQFRVVRDLHCFNLFLGYDGQRQQFRVDLALKAFPFLDSRLGQNVLGEGFDPALGAVR